MIRKDLREFQSLTDELYKIVNAEINAKNRAEKINRINDLLDQREEFLTGLVPPYTEAEKQVGLKVVNSNKEIDKRIQRIFTQLKVEIKQMNKHKRSNEFYENPYKSVQVMDGMFLDQKK